MKNIVIHCHKELGVDEGKAFVEAGVVFDELVETGLHFFLGQIRFFSHLEAYSRVPLRVNREDFVVSSSLEVKLLKIHHSSIKPYSN